MSTMWVDATPLQLEGLQPRPDLVAMLPPLLDRKEFDSQLP